MHMITLYFFVLCVHPLPNSMGSSKMYANDSPSYGVWTRVVDVKIYIFVNLFSHQTEESIKNLPMHHIRANSREVTHLLDYFVKPPPPPYGPEKVLQKNDRRLENLEPTELKISGWVALTQILEAAQVEINKVTSVTR